MLSHVEINGSMFILFQWLVTSQEKNFLVLVLGVTRGNGILDPSLYFISGKKSCGEVL